MRIFSLVRCPASLFHCIDTCTCDRLLVSINPSRWHGWQLISKSSQRYCKCSSPYIHTYIPIYLHKHPIYSHLLLGVFGRPAIVPLRLRRPSPDRTLLVCNPQTADPPTRLS